MKSMRMLLLAITIVGPGPFYCQVCQSAEPQGEIHPPAEPQNEIPPPAKPEVKYPPPGELIDVGGRKMHCLIKGQGPIVVCDAALGEASYDWEPMQDVLAKFAKVVCFDRAGLGWSEPGPLPRTFENNVEDLRILLKKKKLDPPYLLVGNSYGGIDARLYASMYPKEVSGLVLVDAGYFDEFPEGAEANMDSFGPEAEIAFAMRQYLDFRPIMRSMLNQGKETKETFERRVALKSRVCELEGIWAEKNGLAHFRSSCDKMRHLGNMPVTILTSIPFGKHERFKWWPYAQKKLAETVSDNVEWLKVDAHHTMHHDRPDLVSDAVRKTLERVAKSK